MAPAAVTVDLAEEDLADYEWIEESKAYREWLVSAPIVNPHMTFRIVKSDETSDF